MAWTVGDVSASETLTSLDHIYAQHINELRTTVDARLQIGGEVSGTVTAPTLKTRTASRTMATSGVAADHVATGTNDGLVLAAAIAALPSTGGRIFVRNGTYYWDASTDKAYVTKSNVVIEGESPGGVIFQARTSLHPGGSDSLGQFGMLTIGRNNTTKVSNVVVRNIVFDCNNQTKTSGFTIDGGTAMAGSIGLQNVLVEDVVVKNIQPADSDPVKAGLFVHSGVNSAVGNRGYVDGLTLRRCDIGPSNVRGLYLQGGNITNLAIVDSTIHDCNRDGIYIFDYGTTYTSDKWTLDNMRFERNMILTSGSSQAHVRDATQHGIDNLTVNRCYFGPTQNAATTQDYCLTPYWATNLRITNCTFDRIGAGVSIGASIAGAYNKLFPINRFIFEDNIFYQARSCWDPDSTVCGEFRNNIFYEVKSERVFGSYSRHFPTVYDGNIFYDCHTDNTGAEPDYQKSAIQTAGDGFIIQNNYFIDDRKLADPTSNLALSQTAGGALGARTYYVRYTWANDTGETLGSTEQTQAVSANNLLTTDVTFSYIPSGAKLMKIYVSTSSGSGWTLQTTISNPTKTWVWTEPTSGLVAGSALPITNTTQTKTKFGIYELSGGSTGTFGNYYSDNYFIGIDTPVSKISSYKRIMANNYAESSDGVTRYSIERVGYSQGNVSGATTFDIFYGEVIKATLTGNITATILSGEYTGQKLTLKLTQDGTGSRTITWPGNFKKAAGSLALTTTAGATDSITMEYDGTSWIEVSRAMNVG